jgi:prepilin-type N-terminal cleavage/methylation domain-containing protein
MFRRSKGFTIIELLIVIAVIAILIGLTLPRFRGMQEEGNIAKAKGELRTLQTAAESYYIHNNNTYPTALSSLTSATPNIIGSSLPTDPFNGTSNYGYATDGASPVKYYVIYSIGVGSNGSAAVSTSGTVTETNGSSCIYVTNGSPRDTQP